MCNHSHTSSIKNLIFAIILNLILSISQFIGGIFSGSNALLSDAIHNLSDVIALTFSLFAVIFSNKNANNDMTFGYQRAEIGAAFINSLTITILAFWIVIQGIIGLFDQKEIDSLIVIYLSGLSIIINGISILMLLKDSKDSLNIRSAQLHLISDLLTSVAILVGGFLIYLYDFVWIDSVLAILIGFYLIYSSKEILFTTIRIFMQFSPKELNVELIIKYIKNSNDLISDIHQFHIWKIDENSIQLQCHLLLSTDVKLSETTILIENLSKCMVEKFNIKNCFFQCEYMPDDENLISGVNTTPKH